MKKPNFFILGAPKCGTTSLAAWLDEHPNIFISPLKEPNFFNTDSKRQIIYSKEEYEQLFEKSNSQYLWVGEATTNYIYSQTAVPNILNYVTTPSEVKFVVAIRNPIEMAISLHGQRIREGRETIKDFATAWHLQESRAEKLSQESISDVQRLMYGPICRLGEQIERLLCIINPEQVQILVFDDLKENPGTEYQRILAFLELPDDGRHSFPVYNQARSIPLWVALLQRYLVTLKRHLVIQQELGILRRLNRKLFKPTHKNQVDVGTLKELQDYFRADIVLLSNILDRDFGYWLNEPMGEK